jgi:hypothetical protein
MKTIKTFTRAGWLLALQDIHDKILSAETLLVEAFEEGAVKDGPVPAAQTLAWLEFDKLKATIENLQEWEYEVYEPA